MESFCVWDELNGEEEYAEEVEAFDANAAAIEFAEKDTDGHCDGLYHDSAQPIMVRCPDGELKRFHVRAYMEPVFYASEDSRV